MIFTKKMKYSLILYVIMLLIIFGIVLYSSTNNESTNNTHEIAYNFKILDQLKSPDKKTNALLFRESRGGKTASFIYTLYLVDENRKIQKKDESRIEFEGKYLRMKWVENKKLVIYLESDRIYKFTNFWFNNKYNEMYKIILVEEKDK